jgi:putative transposase
MPYRRIVFTTGEVYHVLNRGIAQAPIFLSPKEYKRFLQLIDYYRFFDLSISFSHFSRLCLKDKKEFKNNLKEKQVEIFAFCLMPNHFHLLLRQEKEGGIAKTLSNLQNGYAKYFNIKHKRSGSLFQSMFKAIRIETDEQLLHVSRYIHLNPSSSYLVKIKDLSKYPWSSLLDYLKNKSSSFTNAKLILELAGGRKSYEKFVFAQAEYQRELNKIKHLALEKP